MREHCTLNNVYTLYAVYFTNWSVIQAHVCRNEMDVCMFMMCANMRRGRVIHASSGNDAIEWNFKAFININFLLK